MEQEKYLNFLLRFHHNNQHEIHSQRRFCPKPQSASSQSHQPVPDFSGQLGLGGA